MPIRGESIDHFISLYREADDLGRKVKQALAAIELIKWRLLIEAMEQVDREDVSK
jgi:hypothetical protein